MDAERLRAIARHCRELLRVVRRPEVKEQLREWEHEIEAEVQIAERSYHRTDYRRQA
jgi:uncharacterized protein (DUF111 family)